MQRDNPEGEERTRGFMGRLQSTLDAAKERVGDTAGTVTGKKFRQQFEEFTNVVTTTVVGVHQDQAGLRDTLSRLEQDQAGLRDTLSRLEQDQDELRATLSRLEQDQDELRAALSRLEQSSNNPWWQFWHWRWW